MSCATSSTRKRYHRFPSSPPSCTTPSARRCSRACSPIKPGRNTMPNNPLRLGLLSAALLLSARAHAETLTLEQAIREAMSHSEEALILKEKAVRFKALEQQAWSSGLPRISAYANVGRGASPFDLSSLGFSAPTRYQQKPDGSLVVQGDSVPVDHAPQQA